MSLSTEDPDQIGEEVLLLNCERPVRASIIGRKGESAQDRIHSTTTRNVVEIVQVSNDVAIA
jgi:hypothetical protein